MVTTNVSLTDRDNMILAAIAQQAGKSREELLQEAIEQYLSRHQTPAHKSSIQRAQGMWRERHDLPSPETLRREWDRLEQA